MRCFIFVILLFLSASSFASDKECWNESKACTFTGTLELHTYPGGRSNDDGSDQLETNLYLKLDPSVTVHFKDWENHDIPATEQVVLMEIAGDFDDSLFKVAKKKNHATVRAKIFEQQTGHHHTHFLIDAKNNIIVDKR